MNAEEKNYIASRYHDYADCLPEHRQPEKAEAIKQLMEHFGINELCQNTDTNVTVEQGGVSVSLTSFVAQFFEKSYLQDMAVQELKDELARLKRWREDVAQHGSPENLVGIDELIELVHHKLNELEGAGE